MRFSEESAQKCSVEMQPCRAENSQAWKESARKPRHHVHVRLHPKLAKCLPEKLVGSLAVDDGEEDGHAFLEGKPREEQLAGHPPLDPSTKFILSAAAWPWLNLLPGALFNHLACDCHVRVQLAPAALSFPSPFPIAAFLFVPVVLEEALVPLQGRPSLVFRQIELRLARFLEQKKITEISAMSHEMERGVETGEWWA